MRRIVFDWPSHFLSDLAIFLSAEGDFLLFIFVKYIFYTCFIQKLQ